MNHKIHNDSGQESSQVEMETRKAIKQSSKKYIENTGLLCSSVFEERKILLLKS